MGIAHPKKYTPEERAKAVELASRVGATQASRDLVIDRNLINVWRKKYYTEQSKDANYSSTVTYRPTDNLKSTEEIASLTKQLELTRAEALATRNKLTEAEHLVRSLQQQIKDNVQSHSVHMEILASRLSQKSDGYLSQIKDYEAKIDLIKYVIKGL